jgi:hypothetical protein
MQHYLLLGCLCLTGWLRGQSAACSSTQVEVIIEILTDRYGAELSWELTGSTGTYYAFVRPNTYKNQLFYRHRVCVPLHQCISFRLHDRFGDGIEAPGYCRVIFQGDTLFPAVTVFTQQTLHLQCRPGEECAVAPQVRPGMHLASFEDTWYQFTPDTSGLYRISTRDLNTCDTKIWVYGSCQNLPLAEDNQSTLFFNDNATPEVKQAEIRGYFNARKTYYIRIGDHFNACADSIRWRLQFEGMVRGCTDSTACNYNPLAAIDNGSCLQAGSLRCPKSPDLRIRQDTLLRSLRLDMVHATDACLIQEGCLRGYGVRQVLRFSTFIENIGERDYFIGMPNPDNPQFTADNCHNHLHYNGYAEYILLDESGRKHPVGFKNGLCLTDAGCEPGYNAKFSCDNMGIGAHCYDLYWAALECQWIDVTDVPDGKYTLVVRVNWQNRPDALGQSEKNLDNNVAQVCLRLSRASGKLKYTLDTLCEPYLDCFGVPFGDAQPDCAGVCNGETLSGDVDANGVQEIRDVEKYVTLLLGNDISPTACNDLNADGVITVQDAALLAACLNAASAHPHPNIGAHDHCNFPEGNLLNPKDTVQVGILQANWQEQYVDIGIKNPTTHVSAYQFRLRGGTISHVENLVNPVSYPITPRANMSNGMIVGLSYRDSVIHKSEWMQPLCRVHFSNPLQDTIRLQEITAVLNSKKERTVTRLGDSLVVRRKTTPVPAEPEPLLPIQIHIQPNPFQEQAQFAFYHPSTQYFDLNIINTHGMVVQQYFNLRSPGVQIHRQELPPGLYFYQLIGEKNYAAGKFIIR